MVVLKPVSPFIADTVEHILNYTKHMATVHYENGKYHLHTELETISKEDGGITKDKTSTTEKAENNSQQIKFICIPILRIINNVIRNVIKFLFIPDNPIIKS